MTDTQARPVGPRVPQHRPQSLVLAFFGNHVLDAGHRCVYSGSIIDVLGRAGVGEQAVRSTLSRMVKRGLLLRQRQGRRVYFGLTAQARRVLAEGRRRIWDEDAVNADWDGTWTLLGFSLPEAWQRQRHSLRSRLLWSGFGPLYSGLWIAPGEIEVGGILAGLGLTGHAKVFHARAADATDIAAMVRESWDLDGIAARYTGFGQRWGACAGRGEGAGDAIVVRLRLVTEWLDVIRTDPRLPLRHLPGDWPARSAQGVFRAVADVTAGPARRMAESLVDTVPEPAAAAPCQEY
ncbi:PaaX family transcriptional regulator C-terminal domain-containing protein [Streptomyces sp. NPDC059786]|uniref:PaaX family transcriptional regulator n=1 Tax=Streptomyces sp. NPDC059786 TaxID=3346946 RepID=UPI00364D6E27